jgi:hypothetical protein
MTERIGLERIIRHHEAKRMVKFTAFFADNTRVAYLLSVRPTGDCSDLESKTYGNKTHCD